jgi:putative membrane protein
MFWSEFFNSSLWWIFPLVMIALCFFMMRGRKGSMMCGLGSHHAESDSISDSDSAMDILDKRYALGEVNKEEYEEKKNAIRRHK